MYGILCTLSEARLRILESDPDLLQELVAARRDGDIPGLLDLGRTWDALDVILSGRGEDPLLGDAIVARSGRSVGPELSHGRAHVLAPDRVCDVSAALEALSLHHVAERYESLRQASALGCFGQESEPDIQDREVEELTDMLEQVKALFMRACDEGHSVLAFVV